VNALKDGQLAVGQVVDDRQRVAFAQKRDARVGPDIAQASSNQNHLDSLMQTTLVHAAGARKRKYFLQPKLNRKTSAAEAILESR